MKTILIDDEPMALEVLQHMLSPYKEIDIVGSYTKYTEALESIKRIKPDIIFLDIEMGQINGLELAEIFMGELESVEIVFVTAYSQYAVDAFEINAIDYLLKPIQENRLEKAINRLKERQSIINTHNEKVEKINKLKVYSFGGFQLMDEKGKALAWRTQKARELFAYLWTRKDRISSRDIIIDSVFPDREIDKASALLHTTIYQLRKSLEKLGYKNAIIYSEEGYRLDIPVESDLEDLKKIVEKDIREEADIGEILQIYMGDFLEEGYHWAIELQQVYRQLVFNIIKGYVKNEMENDRLSLNLKFSLNKLYEIDPFNNSVVEMMLDYYGKQGEISSLESFYKKYSNELWHEMELKPTESIINRYNKYIQD